MKLKHPWTDFLIIICILGLGIAGLKGGKGWPTLWWAMIFAGGFGLILFAWTQGAAEDIAVPKAEVPMDKDGDDGCDAINAKNNE